MQGRWYITAGLNPLFDTFDCQEHFFGVPEPGKLYGKINWRIPKGNSDFIERSTVQTFDQVRMCAWKLIYAKYASRQTLQPSCELQQPPSRLLGSYAACILGYSMMCVHCVS